MKLKTCESSGIAKQIWAKDFATFCLRLVCLKDHTHPQHSYPLKAKLSGGLFLFLAWFWRERTKSKTSQIADIFIYTKMQQNQKSPPSPKQNCVNIAVLDMQHCCLISWSPLQHDISQYVTNCVLPVCMWKQLDQLQNHSKYNTFMHLLQQKKSLLHRRCKHFFFCYLWHLCLIQIAVDLLGFTNSPVISRLLTYKSFHSFCDILIAKQQNFDEC